jgi:Glycosyltransferase family 87
VVAFLDGRNPYDQAAQAGAYPVGQGFPPYLPLTLVAHLPFGLVPHEEADALYAVAVLALTAVLAMLALGGAGIRVTTAATLGLTALLLVSRPGQMNLLLGQVTAQVVIGAYVALRWARTKPLVAGLGLALATLKPTYGVPLAVLMLLGRGDVAAVAAGAAISATLCLVALVPLVHAAGGVAPFVTSLGGSATAFSSEHTSNAWSSFARIDVVALAARVLGRVPEGGVGLMLGVAVTAAALVALRRLRGDGRAPTVQLGVGLICLTVLIASYHQAYDALLLTQPAVALGAGSWGRGVVAPPALRWTVLALLAVPAVNFLASGTMVAGLNIGGPAWLAVTAANPLALLAAWGVHLGLAGRTAPR